MSCVVIKQELDLPEENEFQLAAIIKQDIPSNVDETHNVKLEDGETSYKIKEENVYEGKSKFEVSLIFFIIELVYCPTPCYT